MLWHASNIDHIWPMAHHVLITVLYDCFQGQDLGQGRDPIGSAKAYHRWETALKWPVSKRSPTLHLLFCLRGEMQIFYEDATRKNLHFGGGRL